MAQQEAQIDGAVAATKEERKRQKKALKKSVKKQRQHDGDSVDAVNGVATSSRDTPTTDAGEGDVQAQKKKKKDKKRKAVVAGEESMMNGDASSETKVGDTSYYAL